MLGASGINRGTAFTLPQREALGLTGLLPTGVSTLEGQLRRVYAQYQAQGSDLRKWVLLTNLRDRNEVLYYKLLSGHLAEMLPVIYTPTVGQAIQRFSQEFRRTRGVFLSVDHPDQIETALRNTGLGPDDIDLLVATDSEGILGIGDQGIGGIEISIGKLAIYTAAGGIHPRRTLPVVLDVGTDNLQLLNDPLYLGERHARVRDHRYDEFLDAFVAAVRAVFPNAMLHWEDFAADNARRVLHRYTDQICSFNDDLQGTAAVTLAAITSALRVTGERLSDQRIVIHGAGTSGTGIADLVRDTMIREGLTPEQANQRFWAVDRQGLLVDDDPTLRDFQRPYARTRDEVTAWTTTVPGRPISLAEVVGQVHPTVLIGASTQGGAFTENIVKDMAAHVDRPIILPLSNPTSMCEAVPADLLAWTDGRALVATGSPFAAGHPRRAHLPDPAVQQRPDLPRPRPRRHRRPGQPDHRQHDQRRIHRRRETRRPHHPRRTPAPAHGRPAHRRRHRRHRRGHRRRPRRRRPHHHRQPRPTSHRRHVAHRIPATRPDREVGRPPARTTERNIQWPTPRGSPPRWSSIGNGSSRRHAEEWTARCSSTPPTHSRVRGCQSSTWIGSLRTATNVRNHSAASAPSIAR